MARIWLRSLQFLGECKNFGAHYPCIPPASQCVSNVRGPLPPAMTAARKFMGKIDRKFDDSRCDSNLRIGRLGRVVTHLQSSCMDSLIKSAKFGLTLSGQRHHCHRQDTGATTIARTQAPPPLPGLSFLPAKLGYTIRGHCYTNSR